MIHLNAQKVHHADDITVFPNPANEEIGIIVPNDEMLQYTVSLFDLTGRKVSSRTLNSGGTEDFQINLNVGEVQNGIYILLIDNGKESFKKRIVVNH